MKRKEDFVVKIRNKMEKISKQIRIDKRLYQLINKLIKEEKKGKK